MGRHPPWPAMLAAGTVVSLGLGWVIKQRCIPVEWAAGFAFANYCYTDVQAFAQVAQSGLWPYAEYPIEYPVLTGWTMFGLGAATPDRMSYMLAHAALLGALAIVTTLVLAQLAPPRQVLWWAATPPVALYTLYNWDILAVAATVGALWCARRSAWLGVGVLLGLGAAAKIYPAFLLPAFGMHLVATEGGLRRGGWSLGLGFIGAWLAVNLPVMVAAPAGWAHAYVFQATRGPNLETVWFLVGHAGRQVGSPVLEWLGSDAVAGIGSGALLLAALAVSAVLAYRRRLSPLEAAMIPLLAFLAGNKVLSVQYAIWFVPFLVLGPFTTAQRVAVLAADLAVFVCLFTFLGTVEEYAKPVIFGPVIFAVLARSAAYTWLLVSLLKRARGPEPRAAPSEHRAQTSKAVAA